MNQELRDQLEQLDSKISKASRERDVWRSSKGGNHNYVMADKLVKALEKERDNLLANKDKE